MIDITTDLGRIELKAAEKDFVLTRYALKRVTVTDKDTKETTSELRMVKQGVHYYTNLHLALEHILSYELTEPQIEEFSALLDHMKTLEKTMEKIYKEIKSQRDFVRT